MRRQGWGLPPRLLMAAGAAFGLVLAGCDGATTGSARQPGPQPPANEFQATLLGGVNAFRAEPRRCGDQTLAAASPLGWNRLLERAAQGHSDDMARNNFMSHTGSDGLELSDRVEAVGYRWSALAENVAAGYQSAEAVLTGWQGSPGHCANLMNPRVTELGVATAYDAGSDYGHYWTMKLAAPR